MALAARRVHASGIVLRLDYISCLLTIASTILIGRRKWQGWIVAGVNSVVICVIGLRTTQLGFIPANLFCIALYAYNLVQWRQVTASLKPDVDSKSDADSGAPSADAAANAWV